MVLTSNNHGSYKFRLVKRVKHMSCEDLTACLRPLNWSIKYIIIFLPFLRIWLRFPWRKAVFGSQLKWQWFLQDSNIPQTYWITWVLIRFHCIPYSATVFWAPIFRHIRIDFQFLIALFLVTLKPSRCSWQPVGFQSPSSKTWCFLF